MVIRERSVAKDICAQVGESEKLIKKMRNEELL